MVLGRSDPSGLADPTRLRGGDDTRSSARAFYLRHSEVPARTNRYV